MVSIFRKCLTILFLDPISYDHNLDQYTSCVCCWIVFVLFCFKIGVTQKAFRIHLMLRRNDAVGEKNIDTVLGRKFQYHRFITELKL